MERRPLSLPGIPGGDPEPPRRRVLVWIELVVAVGLTVLLGLTALGFLLNASGAVHHRGTSRAGQVVGAAVCLGLLVLCTRWAIRVEHRLRRRHPVAQAFETARTGTPIRARSIWRTRRRGRRYGPVSTGVFAVVFAGIAIAAVAGAISAHSQAVRSNYVQHHGTRALATVDVVDNTQHCSRSSCSYTAAIAVTLSRRTDGAQTTVAHYPAYSDLHIGQQVTVLVDPREPGYAELPGSTFKSPSAWIVLVVVAVMFGALATLEARVLRRLLAHRREHLEQVAQT